MLREIKCHHIKGLDSAQEAIEFLIQENPELIAFDIETSGTSEHADEVIGIAVAYDDVQGFYFHLGYWDLDKLEVKKLFTKDQEQELVNKLCEFLIEKDLVMHNGIFDIAFMYHSYGIDLTPALYADTMMMKHTIDEERPFGLKEISEMLFGEWARDEQEDLAKSVIEAGGKWNKHNKEIWKGNPDLIGSYAVKDVILTAKVFEVLNEELENQGLLDFFYEKEVMPLYKKATIPMKLGGVYTDEAYFRSLKEEVNSAIIKATDEVHEIIAPDIGPKVKELLDKGIPTSRTGQFAEKLLRYYNLPVPINGKSGKPTLAKSALRKLEAEFPAEKVIKWLLWEAPKVEMEVEEYLRDSDGSIIYDVNGVPLMTSVKKLVDDPKAKCPVKLPEDVIYECKKEIFVERNPDLPNVFNLSSNQHLAWLLFEVYGAKPKKKSKKTGLPQVDKDSLKDYKDIPFVEKLLEIKKLEKVMSTYIDPILSIQTNGWIYPSLQQWGTTSGRYSCGGGLNLQTLPRFERPNRCINKDCESKKAKIYNSSLTKIKIECPECKLSKEIYDDAMIKRGFIAPKGYKVVNADFSSLEPRIFSWVSGDPGLKRVYWEGLDLYSQVAIDVLGLEGVSARETDENYLKKVNGKARQDAKVFTLAVPYGAEAGRISGLMGISFEDAKKIIDQYLNAYPGLKDYMKTQEEDVITTGIVSTMFGRVRHLYEAKDLFDLHGGKLFSKKRMQQELGDFEGSEVYYKFKNLLNNAKNFPIQATAAHICNAALVKLSDSFYNEKIDGWLCLTIHDEITCIVKEKDAEKAAKLLQDAMQHNWVTEQIDIPILAEPQIADNFADAK